MAEEGSITRTSGSTPAEPPAKGVAEALIGTTISGRYKIEAVLGSGGMGAVYLAQHTHMRKRCALKLLHAETSQNPELVARFEREAVASAHADHPNIATATDFGRAESGAFFLVLEYLEGQRLRDVLAGGPLPPSRAVHIVRQIAAALERAHELGIIHRDLKPENIMLVNRQGDPDFVKVLDFGLAKVAIDNLPSPGSSGEEEALKTLTRHGSVFGTPRYMSPEQAIAETVDGRTDLYSLGLMFYEMLAGRHAFDGHSPLILIRHQLSTPVPPLAERAPSVRVPASLEALVMRLCDKRPERRPESAGALLVELDAVCAAERIALEPVGRTATPKPLPVVSAPAGSEQPSAALPVSASAVLAEVKLPTPAPPPAPAPTLPRRLRLTLGRLLELLPPALRRQPVLLLAPATLLVVGLSFGLLLALRPAAPTGQLQAGKGRPARSAKGVTPASQAELDQAVAGGVPALTALAGQYPSDARVARLLGHSHLAAQDGVEALHWLGKALALDDSSVQEGELVQAATAALGASETADAALQILESELGSRGVDVLYALAAGKGAAGRAKLRGRVSDSLGKPEVRSLATPAALVAIELRQAGKCESKRALLGRAAQDGDGRTLAQLKVLAQTRGCGPFSMGDCWPCLRGDNALNAAITAITARVGSN